MIKHKLCLSGPGMKGAGISAFALRELLDVLADGTRGALRLRTEGRSIARGADPVWLSKAGEFKIMGLSSGSIMLDIEAPSLAEAAPEKFAQVPMFRNPDESSSAFGIFEESLSDALQSRTDSDLFDDDLLDVYGRLTNLFQYGVDYIEMSNIRSNRVLVIKEADVEQIKMLRKSTPPPQASRIAGTINTIRHSDKMFELVLESGQTLRGIATPEIDEGYLAELWGQVVIVSGKTVFRQSGTILRVEASRIEKAHGNTQLWSKLPKPIQHKEPLMRMRKRQTEHNGINKIWGKWPGDETDEQVAELIGQGRDS